ncbi:hypothetical protein M885DRAFT_506295 [Pelagophyceae sp. CCMP2097]|nr:hypothetical protein M885DRAFT_506295 [Pelagophyceae sp. CCMP2097]
MPGVRGPCWLRGAPMASGCLRRATASRPAKPRAAGATRASLGPALVRCRPRPPCPH